MLCSDLVLLWQQLQVLAHICGCHASDSAALLQCLRAKPSEELLDISKVKRGGRVWGQGCAWNGMADKPHHSLTYFDMEFGKMEVGIHSNGCRMYRTMIGNLKNLMGQGCCLARRRSRKTQMLSLSHWEEGLPLFHMLPEAKISVKSVSSVRKAFWLGITGKFLKTLKKGQHL